MGADRAGGAAGYGDGLANVGDDLVEGVACCGLRGCGDVYCGQRDGEDFC